MTTGRRVFIEGLVIVVSILLAFAIDRTWDNHSTRVAEGVLVRSLARDIRATRVVVDNQLELSERWSALTRGILSEIAAPGDRSTRDSILSGIGTVLSVRTWLPVNDSYTDAVGSGRLSLLRDDSLRLSLARYQGSVDAVDEIHAMIATQYFNVVEPFLVSHTIYSELAMDSWRDSLSVSPFKTDFDALARSRELWNLITLRLELELAVQSRLRRVDSAGEAFIALTSGASP